VFAFCNREKQTKIEEEGVHGKGRGGLGTTQSYRAHPRDEFKFQLEI